MNYIRTTVHIGIEKPFSVLQASDTHITRADARDTERKIALAAKRATVFPRAEENLSEIESYVKKTGLPLIYTGDLYDFVSEANLERAEAFAQNTNCLFVAGNHEFSLYVGEAWEDAAYRNQSLACVQAIYKNNIRAYAEERNGVDFVLLDDSYYLFEKEQLAFLKNEAKKGLPILLFLHNPLYTPALFEDRLQANNGLCANLVAVPEEKTTGYGEYRRRQQKADAVTYETFDFIKSEPLIKAVFAGHFHTDSESGITESLPQYVTGLDTIREIVVE